MRSATYIFIWSTAAIAIPKAPLATKTAVNPQLTSYDVCGPNLNREDVRPLQYSTPENVAFEIKVEEAIRANDHKQLKALKAKAAECYEVGKGVPSPETDGPGLITKVGRLADHKYDGISTYVAWKIDFVDQIEEAVRAKDCSTLDGLRGEAQGGWPGIGLDCPMC